MADDNLQLIIKILADSATAEEVMSAFSKATEAQLEALQNQLIKTQAKLETLHANPELVSQLRQVKQELKDQDVAVRGTQEALAAYMAKFQTAQVRALADNEKFNASLRETQAAAVRAGQEVEAAYRSRIETAQVRAIAENEKFNASLKNQGSAFVSLYDLQAASLHRLNPELEKTKNIVGMFSPEFYKAYASAQLLGYELGTPIPFALARFISQIQGIVPIMNAAFGIIIGGFVVEALVKITAKVSEFLTQTKEAEQAWKAVNNAIKASDKSLENLDKQHLDKLREESEIGKTAVEVGRLKAIYAQDDVGFAQLAADLKKRELDDAESTLKVMEAQRAAFERMIPAGGQSLTERLAGVSSGAISIQQSKIAQLSKEYEVLETKVRNAGDEATVAGEKEGQALDKATTKAESAAAKRAAADKKWADAAARNREHIALLMEHLNDREDTHLSKLATEFEFTKRYEASLREIQAVTVPGQGGPGEMLQIPPETLSQYAALTRNILDTGKAQETLRQITSLTDIDIKKLAAQFPNLILDEQHMTPAVEQAVAALRKQGEGLRQQQNEMRQFATVARLAFDEIGMSLEGLGGKYTRIFSGIQRLIQTMIQLHALEAKSAATAATEKAAAEAGATGSISLVKSVYETAEGIAALARLDFSAAAQHFAASAKFLEVLGVVASVAGAVGSFAGGGGSSGGGRSTATVRNVLGAGSRSQTLNLGAAPSPGGTNVPQVNVNIIGGSNSAIAQAMIKQINVEVTQNNQTLYSTSTTKLPTRLAGK